MKIYCLYGYGKETEVITPDQKSIHELTIIGPQRSYWYMQGEYEQSESRTDGLDADVVVSPITPPVVSC